VVLPGWRGGSVVSGKQRPDYFPMTNGAFAYRSDDHFTTWTQERVDLLNADRARMGLRPITLPDLSPSSKDAEGRSSQA
jgi:hypothetical protein